MDPERWTRVQDVFLEALHRPPADRPAFLAAACGDDPELRAAVAGMLDADTSETFLEPPTQHATATNAGGASNLAGRTLGDCELQELIGEGGMGAVYRAVQQPWNRTVAVKVLRGLPDAAARQRFDFESRVLANIQHPNIAQVYGSGVQAFADSAIEVPYFVMEFVAEAQPITEYVASADADTEACSQLMEVVCDAVHHGHLKAVIHRDLKPANILVDRAGRPKVIDFGIARTTADDAIDRSFATAAGMIIGTPAYMSPEQLAGRSSDIDARADVYALGVVLFEVLCGKRPYEVTGLPWPEAIRVVQDAPLPRPSAVHPELAGDLDTIVQKALAKEPADRYPSAAAMGEDLRRWREGLPIVARPLTVRYQLRLFARRNRVLVGAAAAIVVTLLVTAIWSSWMFVHTEEARQAEQARAEEAEKLVELSREFSEWVTDEVHRRLADIPGSTALRRDLLQRVQTWLDGVRATAGDSPKLQWTVARGYRVIAGVEVLAGFSTADAALMTNGKALAMLTDLDGRFPAEARYRVELLRTRLQRCEILTETGRRREVGPLAREVQTELDALPPIEDARLAHLVQGSKARCVYILAQLDVGRGEWRAAAQAIAQARALLPPPRDGGLDQEIEGLGWDIERLMMHWNNSDTGTARQIWRSIEADIRRVAPTDATRVTAIILRAKAEQIEGDFDLYADGDPEAALVHYRTAIDLLQPLRLFDPQQLLHAHSLSLVQSRAIAALLNLKRPKDARPLAEANLALNRLQTDAAPDSTPTRSNLRIALRNLATITLLTGDLEACKRYSDEGLAEARKLLEAEPDGVEQRRAVAESLSALGTWHFSSIKQDTTKAEFLAATKRAQKLWSETLQIYETLESESPGTYGVANMIKATRTQLDICKQAIAAASGDKNDGS